MKYCKICKKHISKKQSFRNMCFSCYQQYLLNEIDKSTSGDIIFKKNNRFISFLKKLNKNKK